MQKMPMTVQGAEELRTELDRLRKEERPAVVQAIAEARAHGDLSENAEYDAAKDRQGMIEAKIRDIEAKLANAQIIDISKLPKRDKIIFGATVELLNLDTEEKFSYQIVGVDEADIKAGKLSHQTPVARAIIGKSVGDEVDVETPGGVQAYEIISVKYI